MSLVRMTRQRTEERHVPVKAVNKMRQNGWEVDDPQGEAEFFLAGARAKDTPPDEPPKPKRRRSSPETSEAPETDSGAFSRPETEEEGSS